MPQRKLLGDHAAHRQAQHMGPPDIERVHQSRDVISHIGDGVRSHRVRAAADIPVVEDHDLERLGQRRNLRQCPQRGVVPDPHHQYEWRSLPVNFEVQFLAVRLDGTGP
jgi:hypothetical protein